MKHLTEEQIQAFLDGSSDQDSKSLALHLYFCPDCRRTYEEYQKLYMGLAKAEIPDLPASFAEKVMSRIDSVNPEPEKTSLWIPVFALANIAAGLAAIIYFIDFSFLSDFSAFFGQEGSHLRIIIGKIGGYMDMMGVDLGFVFMVGLAILAIGAIDILLRIAKKKPVTFVV